MAGLRQRRGVLAVDHVDRLDEPKEHVHIHRVVRQGALQGTLSFVGMLLPLLAFRALFLPVHYWDVLPMALRCAAGPVGALVWNVGRLENFANGRQRWFIYSLRTLLASVGLIPVLILAPGFTHQVFPDWYTCQVTAVHVLVAVAIGLSAASLDYIWPWVCYKAGLIDSHDPPPSLTGEVISYNPYDDNAGGGMAWGNLLVLVRLVDVVLISPLLQALFFVRFCVEYISAVCAELRTDISGPISVAANSSTAISTTSLPAGRLTNGTGDAASDGSALLLAVCPPVVSYALAAFLWACFQMHFKGDLALRLLIASALFVFVSALPVAPLAPGSRDVLIHESACTVLLFAVALGTRGSAAACLALATRKWWRWNV